MEVALAEHKKTMSTTSLHSEDQSKSTSANDLAPTQSDDGKDAKIQALESKLQELNRLLQKRDSEIVQLRVQLEEVTKEKEELQNFSNIERPKTPKLSHTRPHRKSAKSSPLSENDLKEESRSEELAPVPEKSKPAMMNGAVSMLGGSSLSNVKLRSSGVIGSHSSILEKEETRITPVEEQQQPKPDIASKPKLAFKKEESVSSATKSEPVKQEPKPIVSETKKESDKATAASRFGKIAEPEPKKEAEKPPSKFGFGSKPQIVPAKEATLAPPSASTKATSAPALSASAPPVVKPAASVANVSTEEADVRKWIEATLKDSAVFQNAVDLKSALKDGSVLCKLANKLRTDKKEIKINTGKFGASQLENINNYLKCVSEVFKLPATQSFAPNDLHEGQNIDKVLKHLVALKKALNK